MARPRKNPQGLTMERITATVGKGGVSVSEGQPLTRVVESTVPLCPFSGAPVTITPYNVGQLTRWRVAGAGWIGTKSFATRDEAVFWASAGKARLPITVTRTEDVNLPNDAEAAVRDAFPKVS